MSVTAFLSMWLSNTATAAMMFPIAQAVLHELKVGTENVEKNGVVNNATDFEMDKAGSQDNENNSTVTHEVDSVEISENDRSDVEIVRYK